MILLFFYGIFLNNLYKSITHLFHSARLFYTIRGDKLHDFGFSMEQK